MDRMLNMIIRQVVNKLVNRGVDAGIEQVARRRNDGEGPEELSGEQRTQVRQSQRSARQMMRTARRFTRF